MSVLLNNLINFLNFSFSSWKHKSTGKYVICNLFRTFTKSLVPFKNMCMSHVLKYLLHHFKTFPCIFLNFIINVRLMCCLILKITITTTLKPSLRLKMKEKILKVAGLFWKVKKKPFSCAKSTTHEENLSQVSSMSDLRYKHGIVLSLTSPQLSSEMDYYEPST